MQQQITAIINDVY